MFFCFSSRCPNTWCLVFANLKRFARRPICSFRYVRTFVLKFSRVTLQNKYVTLNSCQCYTFIIIIMLLKHLSSQFKELDRNWLVQSSHCPYEVDVINKDIFYFQSEKSKLGKVTWLLLNHTSQQPISLFLFTSYLFFFLICVFRWEV